MASDHIKIGDVTPWVQYAGDGIQTQFGFSFPIFENDDLHVYLGASQAPETSGYSIAGAGDSAGGLVSFTTPPGIGVAVTLLRNVAIKRTTDFSESGDFRASVINNELDRLTAVAQQLSTLIGRSVRLAETDAAGSVQLPPAGARSSKIAAFDASGDLVAASPAATMVLISAFMEGVVLAADAGAARSLLSAQAQSDVLDDIAVLSPAAGQIMLYDGANWIAGNPQQILRNALEIAALKGDRENMVDGVAEPFNDTSDVDLAASVNEFYISIGDYYRGLVSSATDYGNAGGSGDRTGMIAYSDNFAWQGGADNNLFDGAFSANSTDAVDVPALGVTGLFLQFDFGASKYIDEVKLYQSGALAQGTWKVQGSDDASAWVDLSADFAWSTATQTVATTPPAAGYRYYRLLGVSGSFDTNAWVTEIEFKISGPAAPSNLTLVSEAFPADAQPDTALIHLQVVENEAITINTDLIAKVSRDDGTTWTTAVLAAAGELADGTKIYEVSGIDISGQPAGTDMRYRIETANAKDIEIHGVVLKWG